MLSKMLLFYPKKIHGFLEGQKAETLAKQGLHRTTLPNH